MSEGFEYAIRKDVRNNPIVRELDETRHRELWKSVAIVVLFVGVAMFAGLQRMELFMHGYQVQDLDRQLQDEEELNRRLKVDIETLSAPDRIEREAKERLKLVAPALGDRVVIERVISSGQPAMPASGAVVARR
jgi:cell division protein FtsL